MSTHLFNSKALFKRIEKNLVKCVLRERSLSKLCGQVNGKTIQIDNHLSATMKLQTLLHEGLHLAYPQWNEKKVSEVESWLFSHLTVRQLYTLARLYLQILR